VTGTPSRGFDEKAYLSAKQLKPGEDPYRQHAFNQLESDKLSPDRPIRDTRHYRYGRYGVNGKKKVEKRPTLFSKFSFTHTYFTNEEDFLSLGLVI
jgi:hypothetical protein